VAETFRAIVPLVADPILLSDADRDRLVAGAKADFETSGARNIDIESIETLDLRRPPPERDPDLAWHLGGWALVLRGTADKF
jgi:hypothetical protein